MVYKKTVLPDGLKSIQELLGTVQYARLRFGIGNDFPQGRQVDYVLGKWTGEEKAVLQERLKLCIDAIKTFALSGVAETMNQFNNK